MISAILAGLKVVPWRLVGAVGLVAALALAGWRVSAWREAYQRLPEVQATLAAEVACEPATACQERAVALAEQARAEAAIAAQAALGKAQEAEAKARADASAWRAKYRAAIQSDPDCAAWASSAIKCPL
jgi:hypothetical protein